MNNVYVRLVTYVLSLLIGLIPAWAAGWLSVEIVDGWMHIHLQIEGAVAAVLSATGLSGSVFRIWGTR